MKRPSFQFYPQDWLSASEVRACSVSARGLWIDMICLMHQGEPYGHLTLNGKGILPPILARMVGASIEEVEGWLSELESVGVFSREDDGTIYSRRMIRDEEIRQSRAAGGVKSIEHPNVAKPKTDKKRQEGYPSRIPSPTPFTPPPSSSSSSSSSNTDSSKEESEMSGSSPTAISVSETESCLSESKAVQEVFAHWQQTFNHPRAKLDVKRKKFIRGRLKDGFSVNDLKLAITGCRASPFHMGVNDRNTVYDDLDLICRDAKHVEQFMNYLRVGATATGCPLCAGEKTIPKYDDKGEVTGTSNCPVCQWLNGSIGARFTLLTFGFEPDAKVDVSLQNRVLSVGHWLDGAVGLKDRDEWRTRHLTPSNFLEFWKGKFPSAGKPTPEKIQQYWEEFENWLTNTK